MEIQNKVDASGIVSINLEDFFPEGERVLLDIRPWLYEDLILREKDFREYVKNHEWEKYEGKNVAVTSTADAIIPVWAWMLVGSALQPYARKIVLGNLEALEQELFREAVSKIDISQFSDSRVVIKGCGDKPVPAGAFMELTRMLRPVVKSIMYGEPCSTVPVYKKK